MFRKQDSEEIAALGKGFSIANNSREFVDQSKHGQECARTNPVLLDRHLQMKTVVVDNQEGPLSRSITRSGADPTEQGRLFLDSSLAAAANERLINVETHLGIIFPPPDKNFFERLKILEDRILKIESMYPQIAAHVFNYGEAEIEASYKPKGRVSHFSQEDKAPKKKRTTTASTPQGTTPESVELLKKRILTLKSKLTSSN